MKCRMKFFRVSVECDECGKIFEVLKCHIRNYTFHFCSLECKRKSKKLAKYLSDVMKNSEIYQKARANQERVYIKGIHYSPTTEFKKGWQNTEKGKQRLKNNRKAMTSGMSKPEKVMNKIIAENNLPFKFVGDGQFMVDTKFPDFVYTNKGNKVIEVFGDYWHRDDIARYWHQTEEGTIEYYKDRGYNVLIIWEKELKKGNSQEIVNKIIELVYPKFLLEMALYGYVDIYEFVEKYTIESLIKEKGEVWKPPLS